MGVKRWRVVQGGVGHEFTTLEAAYGYYRTLAPASARLYPIELRGGRQ